MSNVYDWFQERLEIQAIADDITSEVKKNIDRLFKSSLELELEDTLVMLDEMKLTLDTIQGQLDNKLESPVSKKQLLEERDKVLPFIGLLEQRVKNLRISVVKL